MTIEGVGAHAETIVAEAADSAKDSTTATFIRRFYAHVPPDMLTERTAEELAEAARSCLDHAEVRRGRKPKIRVHTPRRRMANGKPNHTIVEIVNDDMPFLVDSVTAELNRMGMTVHLVVHPIVALRRDRGGKISELLSADVRNMEPEGDSVRVESWMRVEVDQHTDPAKLREIRENLERVLADVRVAVEDWKPMLDQASAIVEGLKEHPPGLVKEDVEEGRAFLEWVADNHFTFIGYREYKVTGSGARAKMTVVPESGLGVLRDPDFHIFEGLHDMSALPDHVRAFFERPDLLIVNKANVRSTVHRPVHLDAIGVKLFDKSHRVIGERLFVGLFTSTVYSRSAAAIPLIRLKIERTLARAQFPKNSHDYKALQHILLTYPRDELFQISDDELFRISMGVLHLQERQRVALFVRHDPFQRFASCLVYVPRDRYTTAIRKAFAAVLEDGFGGPVTAYYTQVSDTSVLARLHFIIKTDPTVPPPEDTDPIEERLVEASRSWQETLRERLIEIHGEEKGLALFGRYGDAFSVGYCADNDCRRAAFDIDLIERALKTGALQLNMYRPEGPVGSDVSSGSFRFRIYHKGAPVPLSDVLPMLEHMGLRVMDERPYPVEPKDSDTVWLHDFGVVMPKSDGLDPLDRREAFEEAFARLWDGEAEDDSFNALVLGAGFDWREVVVVRAYAAYLRKAGMPFSEGYLQETLISNPRLARQIVDLFLARHAPRGKGDRADAIRREIEAGLEEVSSLDEDRIIRRFVNLVESTLRTNYFQAARAGAATPHLSFKLDSRRIDELPLPRPMVEIWVYSPRVEGVHLRFGKVARGGLRWSDRREDFRTEVLGLVKAQVVKNAVIVPVGSKGGFVVKRPPAGDRAAMLAEGVDCYRTFIRGMLDLTDNIEGGKVVRPKRVRCHDGEDPYLVVAADKGTATFSDIANGVAEEYGFWLGDAFASGGSAGYDHKAMGITARGAWEAVKRHFRELGIDTQRQDFTVVGVGDMAGDVFGNGMLLSEHIRLIAAFNHLHIFVDPDPDTATSFRERQRLFDEVKEWGDYDRAAISKGGGVFDRKAKSIALSPEIRSRLGIEGERVTPNELIRAILKAQVDLMWFGGIGTYVKAEDESHAEVGDRGNDALRIDGGELGAKVVGEGANLAMTQKGRIEFAQNGGRLNTDAIDNSAGVDCSDHEVNIKIALGDAVASGSLSRKRRDALLEEMTEEVAALVLRDNYLQTASLSVSGNMNPAGQRRVVRYMRALEREGRLNRDVEDLPDDETIETRLGAGGGLSRPELAVMLAYAKIQLFDELLDSDLPEDDFLEDDLFRYFPTPLQKRYRAQIGRHRLRREIIATSATNSTINRAGITFVHDLKDETGRLAADIVRAYLMVREAFDLRAFWSGVEALDNKVDAAVQNDLLLYTGKLVKQASRWFLRSASPPMRIAATVGRLQPGIRQFRGFVDDITTQPQCARFDDTASRHVEKGLPEGLARTVAELEFLISGCDVVALANEFELSVRKVGRLYFAVGERFGFNWLRDAADGLDFRTYWDKRAVDALVEDLYGHQAALVREILRGGGTAPQAIEHWCERVGAPAAQALRTIEDLQQSGDVGMPMLTVANGQLRQLVG